MTQSLTNALPRRTLLRAVAVPGLAALIGVDGGAALARWKQTTAGDLHAVVPDLMRQSGVPGVAVGILHEGHEDVACFGVTSVEHPLPVDPGTLFLTGSITKTVTTLAVLTLVEQGRLDLDAPVRTYLPELQLADADVAARVTLRHLLAHTSGWWGELVADPGPGDDALSKLMPQIAAAPQLAPLGDHFNYSNSGFALAGRVVETAVDAPFDVAARRLVLDPLGMMRSVFSAGDAITHRVAIGHNVTEQRPEVVHRWAQPRASAPFGGLISSLTDQLRYARTLLGEGPFGVTSFLLPETHASMWSAQGPGGTFEYDDLDAVGLGWMLRTVQNTRVVQHGGFVGGQQSLLLLIPERRFALTVLTNAVQGILLHHDLSVWALRHYLALEEPDPRLLTLSDGELAPYLGQYPVPLPAGLPIDPPVWDVRAGDGNLLVQMSLPGQSGTGPSPDQPIRMAFYAPDRVVALDGLERGLRCDFVRRPDGGIGWFRYGGRLNPRAE